MTNEKKQLKRKPRGRPWPPGTSGNPRGRRPGSLNKLSLAVIAGMGGPLAVSEPSMPVFNPRLPHKHSMTQIGGIWRRSTEQDGKLFDRDTGEFLVVIP